MADQNQLMMINPFEAIETGRKRAYAGYEAGQAAAQREALNELYAQATDPRTGQVNMNALYSGLAQRRMGSIIPGMQQAQADIAFKQGQAAKQIEEADKIFWDGARNQLATIPDNDQLAYRTWASRVVQRAPWAAQYLPETLTKDSKRQLLMTAEAALPKGVEVQRGGGTGFYDPFTGSQIGATIENIPEPPAVLAQKEQIARAGKSDVIIGGEGEFGKKIAGGAAEDITAARQSATAASSSINNIQSLLPLVSSPQFISGTLGDARLAVAKALNLPGATETQVYFSGIGRDVADIIKSFGAGTGLSDADREFAKGIAGGDIKLSAPAIRKILWLNANYNNERIRRYNARVAEIAANPLTDQVSRQQLSILHAPIPMANIGPRPVMNIDEARLLAPGTEFVMPNGAVYRVPQKSK